MPSACAQEHLKQRALNLRDLIKGSPVGDEYCTTLRTAGERFITVQWILEVQVALLAETGVRVRFTRLSPTSPLPSRPRTDAPTSPDPTSAQSFLSTLPLPFSQVNITVFHFGLPDKVWNKQRSPSPTRPRPESQTWARSGLPVVPGEDEQTVVWRHQHEQAQAQRVYDPTTGD